MEQDLIGCYREALQVVNSNLTVKSVGLRFPDKARIMFYLYLTTRDPNGALHMNQVLLEANYQEHVLRQQLRDTKDLRYGQMKLFNIDIPMTLFETRPHKEEIANYIVNTFSNRTVTKLELFRELANELFTASEITTALTYLRAKNLATYEGQLKNRTNIHIS